MSASRDLLNAINIAGSPDKSKLSQTSLDNYLRDLRTLEYMEQVGLVTGAWRLTQKGRDALQTIRQLPKVSEPIR